MEHLDEVLERLANKRKVSPVAIRNNDTTAGDIDYKYQYKEQKKPSKKA